MYERILVALDGSANAEQILPHVAALGKAFRSQVTLLRATEPPERLMKHKQAGRRTSELAPAVAEALAERYRDDAAQLAELCPEIDLTLWTSLGAGGQTHREAVAPARVP